MMPADNSGCVVKTVPGGIEIVEAQPQFMISTELLAEIITRPSRWAHFELSMPGPPHIEGGLLKIDAVNRRVIYRMTGVCSCGRTWFGEWPD